MKKIFVLFSGSASSVRWLMENDPNYDKNYFFVGGITNKKDASGKSYFREKGIPCSGFNTKLFCQSQNYFGKLKDMPISLRELYFKNLLSRIKLHKPDLILLSGFMLEITPPLLGYVPIINVHPADLSIRENGKPKYVGDDAVTLALKSGEKSTRSTIHVVEKKVDEGKIICMSEPLLVEEGVSAKEHQEKMKTACDGPAYQKALEMICSGEFTF